MVIGKGIDIDQWNIRANPEADLHKYAELIFDKGTKHSLERLSFQQLVLE